MVEPQMPDLSHLSAEEKKIIEEVFQRQRAEEEKEIQLSQKADRELEEIEKQINERKQNAQRLLGTQDDAICQICQKTKFADGVGHKCFYCQLRSCARCGGRTTSKNKPIWACSLCQKRQKIIAKTGKWFKQGAAPDTNKEAFSHGDISPSTSASTTPQPMTERNASPLDLHNVSGRTSASLQTRNEPAAYEKSRVSESQILPKVSNEQSATLQRHSLNAQSRKQGVLHRQSTLENEVKQDVLTPRKQLNGGVNSRRNSTTKAEFVSSNNQAPDRTRRDSKASFSQDSVRKESQSIRYSPYEERKPLEDSSHKPGSASTSQYDDVRPYNEQQYSDKNSNRYRRDDYIDHGRDSHTDRYETNINRRPMNRAQSYRSPRESTEYQRLSTVRSDSDRFQETLPADTGELSFAPLNKSKKTRLFRQCRSMSSSEEDSPSTSGWLYKENSVRRPDTDLNSEKDILHYIYGSDDNETSRKMSLGSDRRFQLSSITRNKSLPSSPLLYDTMLTPRLRSYISHPVTWQPSADQRRLIGHMILHKTDGLYGDLGFKVVGGRRSDTGRLGAFITRVKPGSVADAVGRLKAGDEVLEWNGHQLQNTTFGQVYEIINSSRNDTQVELIVCRSVSSTSNSENYLSVQRLLPQPFNFARDVDLNEISFDPPLEPALTHSQSVTLSPHMQQFLQNTNRTERQTIISPFHTGYRKLPFTDRLGNETMAKGQIFGRIEISLCYSPPQRQLVVTIHRAVDLAPRPDGVMRNPYVKIFLLPDRSEKSRRQSAVLAETCTPVWDEPFYYHGLTEAMLIQRVLEVTVWDYDKFESNSFLGETLIDLSETQFDDEPILYTLVDMDEENPLRARLRQRRSNVYQPPTRPRSEMSHYSARHYDYGEEYNPYLMYYGTSESRMSDYRQPQIELSGGMHKSRTYDRGRMHVEEDWTINNSRHSGYLSDQAYSSPLSFRCNVKERRPRSATALRQKPTEKMISKTRNLPNTSWTINEQLPTHQTSVQGIEDQKLQQIQYEDPRTRSEKIKNEIMQENMAEYGSDGSETMSVHSSRSMPSRTVQGGLPNGDVMRQTSDENHLANTEYFIDEDAVSDSTLTKSSVNIKEKERKKGLINRLHIPGRSQQIKGKRAGFSRTEEVGVPEWLAATPFTKQVSKESTESGHTDNWGPVLTEGPLGAFVEDLGPGQVVGRQVLASPVLGEINIGVSVRDVLEIQVVKVRNLVAKPGKALPAPYVKIYLLEGKQCIAKAKTNVAARSKNPEFQQQFVFNHSPRKKMLQITLMGEYRRMERRSFMGIAQIRLDDLDLSERPLYGWYKLFHSSSLAGAAPTRKDSETSLNEIKQ